MSSRKVIIFDSGVGGLSIWQEVQMRLPDVECHYLFDNAFFPYGELEELVLVERVCSLIPNLVEKVAADAVIVACNTASTTVLDELRGLLMIPVVGVVPAIKPASALTETGHIGVLATPATVERSYTRNLVEEFAKERRVTLVGSSNLVKLAESYLLHEQIDEESLNNELSELTQHACLDVVVLGCTHFPLIRDAVAKALHPDVKLVDSGEAIARQLERILPGVVLAEEEAVREHHYYFTQESEAIDAFKTAFARFGIKKGRFFNLPFVTRKTELKP